jgi:hypothetical protein
MAKNRKDAEKFIIKLISLLTHSAFNVKRYETFFSQLSDKEFDTFIEDLKTEKRYLTVQIPNFSEGHLTVENNIQIAKQLGYSFFQKIMMGAKGDVPAYLTPVEFLIVDLPLRRASQMLIKKLSVSDHNRSIDMLTGQVAGDSKASKISYPELQIAAAMDLEDSLIELIKYRGGDIKGGFALDAMLKKYGHASLSTLKQYSSGVESTKTLKTFLNSMHLKSTL